ncbi:MAG: hypothetical protein SFV81_00715 [Pirellulaceae bacterium]|nr:hypothetical protein [Pirellulaceae bacterium]
MSTEHGQFDRLQGSEAVSQAHAPKLASWLVAFAILVMVALSSGCRQIYLPRIDPTGQNIFLPFPNTTPLELSSSPAFQQPVAPPACVDGGDGGVCNLFNKKRIGEVHKSLHKSPGACGEIQLTPMRVVAPVGGEVVLLAGICGEDGYLVKRQPIEWMLSPDSVGTFIEVGDDMKSKLISTLSNAPKVEKLDVDFARGRTSNKETLITRGTPRTDDDIQLKDGQTWLSISSPSEGVSRVTVLAPESELWDQRRQTAMIYWVDAQWEFHQPQVANSGEEITLLTRVTKSGDVFKPATGWKVLYTIVDPNVAVFMPVNPADANRVVVSGNVARVMVDESGQASVKLSAPPGVRGTTPILIEVIRPSLKDDNLPEILLGSGQTLVTFSSAALQLQSIGPKTASVGEQITYKAFLANPGDRDAENVKLAMRIPAGMQFVAATPEPRQYQDQLLWDQGPLPAQRQIEVSVVLQAQQIGDYQIPFIGNGEPNLSSTSSVETSVIQPSVNVRFEPVGGVAQEEMGKQIFYEVDVTNTGRQALTDLRVIVETAAGLPEAEKGANVVEWVIPMLQPGQTTSKGIAFSVQREGELPAKIKVLSGNSILAERSSAVFGTKPAPKMPGIDVSISFPENVTVGSRSRAMIAVKNTGRTTLTGIRLFINSDPALRAIATDADSKPFVRSTDNTGTRLEWTPRDMLPGTDGETIAQLLIEYEAQSPVAQAGILVEATCNEQVRDQAQVMARIVSSGVMPPGVQPGVQPPGNGGIGGLQPRTGALRITLNDFEDPTNVGKTFRYALGVTNNQNLGDRNVRIQLKMPPEIELLGVSTLTGNNVAVNRNADGVFEFQTEKFLGPGQDLQYVLTARGVVAREQVEVAARVFSDEQPTPQEVTTTTTINPKL